MSAHTVDKHTLCLVCVCVLSVENSEGKISCNLSSARRKLNKDNKQNPNTKRREREAEGKEESEKRKRKSYVSVGTSSIMYRNLFIQGVSRKRRNAPGRFLTPPIVDAFSQRLAFETTTPR